MSSMKLKYPFVVSYNKQQTAGLATTRQSIYATAVCGLNLL